MATERPILFSGGMVMAILEGRKTQTRRVMKPQPKHPAVSQSDAYPLSWYGHGDLGIDPEVWNCPYGVPGDRLWVRETWWSIPEPSVSDLRDGADTWPEPTGPQEQRVAYAADGDDPVSVRQWGWKLRPSIFMPRWASRITLEITDVRVQRVQEISAADCAAEGIRSRGIDPPCIASALLYLSDYQELWDSINAKRGFGWEANPWVWALSFRRLP